MGSTGVGVAFVLGLAAAGVALAAGEAVAGQQCGKAAWYDLAGTTANGERSDSSLMAAAHRTLPFNTRVKVENLGNGRSVVVRINDRGPFTGGRVIDLTKAAADRLGFIKAGVARVRITVVDGDRSALSESCGGVVTASARAPAAAPAKAAAPAAAAAVVSAPRPAVKGSTLSIGYSEADPSDDAPAGPLPGTVPAGEGATTETGGTPPEGAIPEPPPRPAAKAAVEELVMNDSLALRFRDAFAPDYTSTLPLGYAPVDRR